MAKQRRLPARRTVGRTAIPSENKPFVIHLSPNRLQQASVARYVARCDGDWRKALLELQQRGIVNELTNVPEMHEIISSLPEGHEILDLVDLGLALGELEALN